MSAVLIADKLRASLLQAAIQGKLTKQLPEEDGDARDLLKEIEAEKTRLIEEKIIKKEKLFPPITDEEIPFEIPENWVWVRLQDIFNIVRGGSPRPIQQFITTKENGINWIKIGDTDIGGKYINNVREKILPEGIKRSRFVHKGDLLLTNSMSYGRPYILNVDGCIHDGWLALSPYIVTINNEFFYYLLSSYFIKNQFNNTVAGAVVKNLNRDKVKEVFIPLPPLAEQYRIVEAIETALAKIDKLKTDEDKLYDIQKAFPNKLRASLLQSAIQGQLTEQLPEDGDARDLLKEIEAEKVRLIEEKVIRKEKPLPPITEDEIPFEIPENWVWVRLGEVALYIQRGKSPKYSEVKKYPVISQKCVQWTGFDISPAKFIDPKSLNSYTEERFLQNNDLLWNSTGLGTVGRISRYQTQFNTYGVAVADSHVSVIRFYPKLMNPLYIELFIASPHIQQNIENMCSGTTKQKELNLLTIKLSLVPIPPLTEQQRIVEKLDEILGKVDELNKEVE